MSLTLSYHAQTTVPVEIEGVVPDRLRDQSLAEIERLEAYQGNQKLVLADLFRISGDPADARIDFEGDLAGVHYIGYGMADGEIHVHGNAGRHLGSEMSGGRIEVEGDASDWVGGEMHGGLIRVAGSAGHLIGAAYRGSKRGMTDGTILIGGDVGNEIGAAVREQSALAEIDRQYSLSEIAIITRAGPAQILGLKHKGHLGPGADADITIYTPNANYETMFELPRFVIKAGIVIVEQGEIRAETYGKTLHVAPDYDRGVEPDIQKWFEDSYSIRWRNYPVETEYLHDHEVVD